MGTLQTARNQMVLWPSRSAIRVKGVGVEPKSDNSATAVWAWAETQTARWERFKCQNP